MDRHALVISYHAPQPDRDSGSRRVFHFLQLLQESGWEVVVYAADGAGAAHDVRRLTQQGIPVYDGYAHSIDDVLGERAFKLVLIAYWPNAERYLPRIRSLSPGARVVLDSVDLHFLRESRAMLGSAVASPGRGLTDADGSRFAAELNTYASVDLVLTVSEKEADLLNDFVWDPGLAHAVRDCEDVPLDFLPFSRRRGIVCIGSFEYPPNVDAVRYLCEEILPKVDPTVLAEHPVWIVGNKPNDTLRYLAREVDNVHVVGWVPSVLPYLAQARISVVPLRYGAGTKRKLVQALGAGTPTVSTSIGVEGLAVKHEEHVLVADDADAFAAQVVRLLADAELWTRLARAGRASVSKTNGRTLTRRKLAEALDVAFARPPNQRWTTPEEYAQLVERLQEDLPDHVHATRPQDETGTNGRDEALQVQARGSSGEAVAHEDSEDSGATDGVRLIAFYLPQFHPIPENDEWWGKGFTEWRNVARARPLFRDHYQPHVPADLGFYDLRLAETRQRQAELARDAGIHGFCYHHYWFHGKRLLHRPFDEVLATGEPAFPFALCWANDPWSRRWDGREDDLLQAQSYSAEDDVSHVRWLLPALSDPRAITVEGRPMFLIYRGSHLPEPARTCEIWRREVERAGLPGIYLVAVETAWELGWDATEVGFDAKVLFQPQFGWLMTHVANEYGRIAVPDQEELQVYDFDVVRVAVRDIEPVHYRRYETVFPSWDNSPRVGKRAVVMHNASPSGYGEWLSDAIGRARTEPSEHRIVFVNAWNEWAEGCHLEPDLRHGHAYLEATRRALRSHVQHAKETRAEAVGPRSLVL